MGFYDTDNLNGQRYIILSDLTQAVPTSRLSVIGRRMQKTTTGTGEYPVLDVQDADGNKYQVSAWKRDVRLCISEWGGEPEGWGFVCLKRGPTRYEIVPAENQNVEEEPISPLQ